MLLIPDPSTFVMDPFTEVPTLGIIADVIDPVTRQRYDRDPRYIATKAEMYLASSGLADEAMFGAEAEFFVFDNVSFDQSANQASITLTPMRDAGIRLAARTTWAIVRATAKAISPCRPPITIRICERRCC